MPVLKFCLNQLDDGLVQPVSDMLGRFLNGQRTGKSACTGGDANKTK